MKTCSKCNIEKEKSQFYFRKDSNKYRSWCKLCEKQRVKKYAIENKDKVKEAQHNKYLRKKEYYKKKSKEWFQNNKERALESRKNWRKNNIERARVISARKEAKRRCNKLQRTPKWADMNKIAILYEKAKWLESITGLKYHVDHIIPLQGDTVSGLHIWENLQILEQSINCSKSNSTGGVS